MDRARRRADRPVPRRRRLVRLQVRRLLLQDRPARARARLAGVADPARSSRSGSCRRPGAISSTPSGRRSSRSRRSSRNEGAGLIGSVLGPAGSAPAAAGGAARRRRLRAPVLGPRQPRGHHRGHVGRARQGGDPVDPALHPVRQRHDARLHRAAADPHPLRADQAHAGRAGGRHHSLLRGVRRHLRLLDRHHAGDRHGDVSGHAPGRLRQQVLARRHHVGRHARHHHPAVDPDDHLRAGDGDVGDGPVRRGLRPGPAHHLRAVGLLGLVQLAHADRALRLRPSSGSPSGRGSGRR